MKQQKTDFLVSAVETNLHFMCGKSTDSLLIPGSKPQLYWAFEHVSFHCNFTVLVQSRRARMQRYIQSRTFGNWGDKYLPQALLETKTKLEGFFFNFMGGFKHIYKETLVDVRLSGYHLVMAEGETCTSLTWLNGDAQQSGSEQFGALR